MNGPFVVAQANAPEAPAIKKPVRIVKVTKPLDGQAITIELGYEQQTKLDLSGVANEKMTFVHIGEKLIILFDNNATVTVEPFFDSMGVPLQNLTVEVTPGRELPSGEFASLFPITTDQSVLAGAGNAAQNPPSGANFSDPSVEPLLTPTPLPLLGPEELPNWVVEFETIPLQEIEIEIEEEILNGFPSLAANPQVRLDDENLAGGIVGGTGDDPDAPVNASGVLAHDFGPDGAGTVLLSGAELPAGFTYAVNADGTQLTIFQNGTPVLLVALSDTVSGAYTVTQLASIGQPAGGDENDVQFTINYVVTDSSGDFVEGAFGINVDDDTPIAVSEAISSGTVDEDGVLEGAADAGPGDGIPGGPDDFVDTNADGDNDESTASGNVSALFLSGADVPLTYSLVGYPGGSRR